MEVRKAVEADLEFLVYCAKTMAFETEGKILDVDNLVRPGILHCLKDDSLGCYYVACMGGK